MPAICNLCPSSTKGIVWFKFSNRPWLSYTPTTFPFAYQTIDNGDGSYTLTFYRRPIITQRRWSVSFSYNNAETGQTYNAILAIQGGFSGFAYGDATKPEITISVLSGAWQPGFQTCNNRCICDTYYVASVKDKCGNVSTGELRNTASAGTASSGTKIHPVSSTCQAGFQSTDRGAKASSAPTYSATLQNFNSTTDSCSACPSGWELDTGNITGTGNPQIQITCGSKVCPPTTHCQCDCNGEVCCFDIDGNPIFTYIE